MKKKFVFSLFILLPFFLFSQQGSDPLLLMQGLKQNDNQFFQLGNYIFNVVTEKRKYNEKEINKVLKKYDIKKTQKKYSDPSLTSENTIVESEELSKDFPGVTIIQKVYFFPISEKKMKHVAIQTIERDSLIEKSFMDAFFNDSLDKYIGEAEVSTRELNFLGREIKLGATCHWMFVNNLQCPSNGQMSWKIYPTLQEARKNSQLEMVKNAERKILKSEELNVIFEEVPVIATRVVYKFGLPRIIMGGPNILAVYYVVANVRGQNVSCILSSYVDNENDYSMGALLHEVMELVE